MKITPIAGAMLLISTCGSTAHSQIISERAKASSEPRFALVIKNPDTSRPSYSIVQESPSAQNSYYYLCEDKSAFYDKKHLPPSACGIVYHVEGDNIAVIVTIYFGDFDHNNIPYSLRGVPSQQFGPYYLHLGQHLQVRKMTDYGVSPLDITVVAARAPGPPPGVASEVPSATIEYLSQDSQGYYLKLHNIGHKPIVAVHISLDKGSGQDFHEFPGAASMGIPLISAGAEYRFKFGRLQHERQSQDPTEARIPPKVILRAALFADNSYEGDEDYSANLMGERLASKYQWTRLLGLVADIAAAEGLDDAARISRIRKEVPGVPDIVDPEMMNQLRSHFPNLTLHASALINQSAMSAMASEKIYVLQSVGRFERQRALDIANGRRAQTLAQWLESWRKENPGLPVPAQ